MADPIVTGARVKVDGDNHAVRTYVFDGDAGDVSDSDFGAPGAVDGVVVVADDGLAVRVDGTWETVSYDA